MIRFGLFCKLKVQGTAHTAMLEWNHCPSILTLSGKVGKDMKLDSATLKLLVLMSSAGIFGSDYDWVGLVGQV